MSNSINLLNDYECLKDSLQKINNNFEFLTSAVRSFKSCCDYKPCCEHLLINPVAGRNATYVGFGGSSGETLYEQHWIHNFTWSSKFINLKKEDLLENSTYSENAVRVNNSIRLSNGFFTKGNVFHDIPVHYKDEENAIIDWNAYYEFSIGGSQAGGSAFRDGLTFILQSNSPTAVGGGSEQLGFGGIPFSIGISYDTYQNTTNDTNANTIEINVNGSLASIREVVCPFSLRGTLGTTKTIYNWVEYHNGILNVYISETSTKPSSSIISEPINVNSYLTRFA
jgi:hypothetical protein